MKVLDISLNEDYTKETINETISNNGDAMGLTHKENEQQYPSPFQHRGI